VGGRFVVFLRFFALFCIVVSLIYFPIPYGK
jgi:hypothetical protein